MNHLFKLKTAVAFTVANLWVQLLLLRSHNRSVYRNGNVAEIHLIIIHMRSRCICICTQRRLSGRIIANRINVNQLYIVVTSKIAMRQKRLWNVAEYKYTKYIRK